MFPVTIPNKTQGAAASPLALLSIKRITVLTDAAMHLFSTLHQVEREAKQAATDRLKAEMDRLDLFGPGEHYRCHEDYRLSDGGRS
jgi:hypothetical protein